MLEEKGQPLAVVSATVTDGDSDTLQGLPEIIGVWRLL